MQENYLDVAANVAFNYLTKTNRMLIINDKNDSFFDTFFDKFLLFPSESNCFESLQVHALIKLPNTNPNISDLNNSFTDLDKSLSKTENRITKTNDNI